MAEITAYHFEYKEVVEALTKRQGLHEGIWQLSIEYGFTAANIGPSDNDLKPAAIIPLVKIGIGKVVKETNLTVDAAKVNPVKKEE